MFLSGFLGHLGAFSVAQGRISGGVGWAMIAAVVLGWDMWAWWSHQQTLSAWFLGQVRRPRRRWLLASGWGLLTWHLFGGRPDPLRRLLDPR